MRIGFSSWGFLSDYKLDKNLNTLSTPDGTATYLWSIIWEMQQRNYQVYAMQQDRDFYTWRSMKKNAFAAFSQEKRLFAYEGILHTQGSSQMLPELDILLLEWRFPIDGRNCKIDENKNLNYDPYIHQPDLFRQIELLQHYKQTNTKIIIWDLDHKLTIDDENRWQPDAIFETSVKPLRLRKERVRVEPPTIVSDLLQHTTSPSDVNKKLVYVGSRYERDDIIDEWIKPASDVFPNQIEFYGNWLKTLDECKQRWPNIKFCDRITTSEFRKAYGDAVSCPLLAKKSYLESGFITPRPWEALLFGTIPVGLSSMTGIEQYVLPQFIAKDGQDMIDIIEYMSKLSESERNILRKKNVDQLEFVDAKFFVNKIEKVTS
jgi:hypothetical protein